MGTYFLSLILISLILIVFSGKNFFENKFKIVLFVAAIAIIPTTIVNGIKGKNIERENRIMKSSPLIKEGILINALTKDTSLVFVKFKSKILEFKQANKGLSFTTEELAYPSDSASIVFIKVDSLNIPRWEVSAEVPIKTKNIWYSSRGIPRINEKRNLYLPDDSIHHAIVRRWINEKS